MRLKRMIRDLLDAGANATGLLARFERARAGTLTILTYHRVLPDEQARAYPLDSLAMPESHFRMQMALVAERFVVLPLREALDALRRGSRDALMAITFDDGYDDNANLAAPILDENGIRGTFFIVSDFVLANRPMWFDLIACAWTDLGPGAVLEDSNGMPGARPRRLHDLLRALKGCDPQRREALAARLAASVDPAVLPQPMTPRQARELAERGHEIASHTKTHPLLPQLDDETLMRELTASRDALADLLGVQPDGLCYPNGDHDARVVDAARDAGYTYACTTRPGANLAKDNPYCLCRIDMTPRATSDACGRPSALATRAQITLLHERLQRMTRS